MSRNIKVVFALCLSFLFMYGCSTRTHTRMTEADFRKMTAADIRNLFFEDSSSSEDYGQVSRGHATREDSPAREDAPQLSAAEAGLKFPKNDDDSAYMYFFVRHSTTRVADLLRETLDELAKKVREEWSRGVREAVSNGEYKEDVVLKTLSESEEAIVYFEKGLASFGGGMANLMSQSPLEWCFAPGIATGETARVLIGRGNFYGCTPNGVVSETKIEGLDVWRDTGDEGDCLWRTICGGRFLLQVHDLSVLGRLVKLYRDGEGASTAFPSWAQTINAEEVFCLFVPEFGHAFEMRFGTGADSSGDPGKDIPLPNDWHELFDLLRGIGDLKLALVADADIVTLRITLVAKSEEHGERIRTYVNTLASTFNDTRLRRVYNLVKGMTADRYGKVVVITSPMPISQTAVVPDRHQPTPQPSQPVARMPVHQTVPPQVKASPPYRIVSCKREYGKDFAWRFALELKGDGQIPTIDAIQRELREFIKKDYVESVPGVKRTSLYVEFPEYELKNGKIEGRAVVLTISVTSLAYDPNTRRGKLAVKVVKMTDEQFETTRAWIRKNIETLARDKNIALTTGVIPPAARFYLGREELKDGNILEIEFKTE